MLTSFLIRLRALLDRRGADAELDDELRYHLERETERNVANGMSPPDAHDAARARQSDRARRSGARHDALAVARRADAGRELRA